MSENSIQEYRITYDGKGACVLLINTRKLELAQEGRTGLQVELATQFCRHHGKTLPRGWMWRKFTFEPASNAAHSAPAKDETYGCTCEDNCPGCDQGHHRSCRYCKMGQKVTS